MNEKSGDLFKLVTIISRTRVLLHACGPRVFLFWVNCGPRFDFDKP